jgi:hypothetical protein
VLGARADNRPGIAPEALARSSALLPRRTAAPASLAISKKLVDARSSIEAQSTPGSGRSSRSPSRSGRCARDGLRGIATAPAQERLGARKRKEKYRARRRDDAQDVREDLLAGARAARGGRKAEVTGELIRFGIATTLLLIFLTPVGLLVLFFGGMRHYKRFYRL